MTITIRPGYEKVTCEHCAGTGRLPKGAPNSYYTWKSDRRCKPNCSECGGIGFRAVRIKPVDHGPLSSQHRSQGE